MTRSAATVRCSSARGQAVAARGEDHHARILLDLEDALRGGTWQATLRAPKVTPDGRVRLEERTLQVRIHAGMRPGQLIRLAGQGGPGAGRAACR